METTDNSPETFKMMMWIFGVVALVLGAWESVAWLRTKSFHCFYCFYSVFAYYRWWERQPNNIVLNWILVVASAWRGSRIRNVDFWWQMMRWNFSPSHVCLSEVPLFWLLICWIFVRCQLATSGPCIKFRFGNFQAKNFEFAQPKTGGDDDNDAERHKSFRFSSGFSSVAYVWFGWDKLKVIRWQREWMSSRHDMILITLPE